MYNNIMFIFILDLSLNQVTCYLMTGLIAYAPDQDPLVRHSQADLSKLSTFEVHGVHILNVLGYSFMLDILRSVICSNQFLIQI